MFKYAKTSELIMVGITGIAGIAACTSGIVIASYNILFGKSCIKFTDFDSGNTAADSFRRFSSRLAICFFLLGVGRLAMRYMTCWPRHLLVIYV